MTITPETAEQFASALAAASRERRPVFILGGGTKSDWLAPSPPTDRFILSTSALNRIVAHRHGDLTATVEAGVRLADLNRALAEHGQWLALDSAWPEQATIGGIVATNDSGARRHRYGAPRDQIIGVEIAGADGTRAKSGGIVVKNVAGYDVARLMTGSFGCLGVILSATFKLYPLTSSSRTVIAELPSHAAVASLVAAMNASQLTPTAVELDAGSPEGVARASRILIRFESTPASTATQCAAAVRLAESVKARAEVVEGDDEQGEWRVHDTRPWSGDGAIFKLTLLPSDTASVLDSVAVAARGAAYEVAGRVGLGVLLVRIVGDAPLLTAAITNLRARVAPGRGSITLLRGSDELKASVDAWGPIGGAFRVMQAVKRTFDPQGILNPGRGPRGL